MSRSRSSSLVTTAAAGLMVLATGLQPPRAALSQEARLVAATPPTVAHRTAKVDGLDIFYREAGSKDAPAVLLLHGFPTSSHMFRNLIPALADRYHAVAPDYPGFGNSSMPKVGEFGYTFDHLADVIEQFTQAVGLNRYSLYVMDYGAPVGFRLATRHPERVEALIVQNGNAYDEGLDNDFWEPIKAYWKDRTEANAAPLRKFLTSEATRWQYTHGVRNVEAISPDNWNIDQPLLDRPGNAEIQTGALLQLRVEPAAVPRVAGVLPQAPAADADRLGEERRHLPGRGGAPLQA
jgi:pimeloyl-ACP methyl ester carboxylesterase